MDTDLEFQHLKAAEDARQIPIWAGRYAKSRTIPFLAQWVFIVMLGLGMGTASSITAIAYQRGHMPMLAAGVVILLGSMASLTWFAVPRWGGKQVWLLGQRLYGEEGYAVPFGESEDPFENPFWVSAACWGLAVYHVIGAALMARNQSFMQYLLPFSAQYMVPFLTVMIVKQRLGFWAWIWPVCYGLHAALLLVGVPLGLTGHYQVFNVVIAVFGYALLSILVGHIYSRYALHRLRLLVRTGLQDYADADETED